MGVLGATVVALTATVSWPASSRLVNVTVGLPFVRTSPGHGTAFDLAAGPRAEAMADAEPTLEAARVALDLALRNPR